MGEPRKVGHLRPLSPVRRELARQADESLEELVFHHVREEVIDFSPRKIKRT